MNQNFDLCKYDVFRRRVIDIELDKVYMLPSNERDIDHLAILYQALIDDGESLRRGQLVRRTPDGIEEKAYQSLWKWILEEADRLRNLNWDMESN